MKHLAALWQLFDKDYRNVLLTVGLPMTLQVLLGISLNLVDLWMIGDVGTDELAAVGASLRLFSFFAFICFGIGSGFTVYTAQYWGVRDIRNIRRVFGLTVTSIACLGLFFFSAASFFAEPLLGLFVQEAHVIALSESYLRIMRWTFFCTGFSFAINISCRAIRRLRPVMIINGLALATNTFLNYGLIFGNFGLPELGIEGAGWALLIARVFELTTLIIYVYVSKEHPLAGKLKEIFSFDKVLAGKVLRTSAPVIATEASFGLVTFLTFIAFGLVGSSTIAVMQVATIVNEFFMAIFIGLVNSAAVITGNELGRGETELAYKHGKMVIGLVIVLGLIISIMILLLRQPIVYIYGFYYEASNMFYSVLLVYAVFMIPRMVDYALVCAMLRAGGDTRFCLIVNSAALWLISVPFAFISAYFWQWPLYGVLAMVLLGDAVSGIICFFRFRSKKWLQKLI